MTTINIITKKTGFIAPVLLGSSRLTIQARNALGPFIQMDGSVVVFPELLQVEMLNGVPVHPVIIPPTDGTFFYHVTVDNYSGALLERDVAVPNQASVDFEDLIDVDPQTFEPTESNTAAWLAAIASVQAVLTDVDALAVQAQVSAIQAADSLTAAELVLGQVQQVKSATEASVASLAPALAEALSDIDTASQSKQSELETAKQDALGALDDAKQEAQAVVDGIPEAAAQAVDSAEEAAQVILTQAQTTASQAVTDAQTARTGAQTARTGAETAKTGAETARAAAEAARDETLTPKVALGNIGGPVTLTSANTKSKYLTGRLTSNLEIALEPGTANQAYTCTLKLQQDGTGSRTLRLVNVATSEGLPILLSTAANSTDILRLEWDGTVWTAFLSARNVTIPTSWVV